MKAALEEQFRSLKAGLVEADKSLRELEQRSKVVTQHVEASVFALGDNK
jgi:hypothetical protein